MYVNIDDLAISASAYALANLQRDFGGS